MRKTKRRIKLIFILLMIIGIIIITCASRTITKKNDTSIFKQEKEEKDIENINDNITPSEIDYSENEIEVSNYDSTTYKNNEVNENRDSLKENNEIQINPHKDENTGIEYITYEDFGAKSDDNYDNYEAIKAAHNYANLYNYEVRATLPSYNIYKLDDIDPIVVKTNTNWNNAKIIIHDENINNLRTKDYPIFKIESTEKNIIINDTQKLDKIKISKDTKKISELAGYGNRMCIAYNEEKKQYIRSGYNSSVGNAQTDFFKIDNDGNVLNEIQWDFDKVTKIMLIPIQEETLTIQNAEFVTVLPKEDYEQKSGYFNRNIICNRSNTIIKNINHTVDNEEKIGGPYFGFIRISYVADVELDNLSLYSHKYKTASNYDLILEYCVNIIMDNITSNDIEATDRWGITGTNYTKDIIYKNCTLNRIDSHCGVYNLTIKDCVIGVKGLPLNGAGKLSILNTARKGGNEFINLRSDYGSTWNGDIEIYNCTFDSSKTSRLISFSVSYDKNGELHDYGYDRVLPNIYIDGLIINNTSNDYLLEYIFLNNESSTGNAQDDLIKAGYILPSKIEVKNYSIENEKRLKAFYKDFEGSKNVSTNIAIPDKPVLNLLDSEGKEYESGNLTNKDITLNVSRVKNVTNEISVNEQKVDNNSVLTKTGEYSIVVVSVDIAGNTEQDNYEVIIDKIAPTIEGVEKGSVYYESVTPIVKDNDIKSAKLYLSGNLVNGYKLNSTIEQVGRYDLEVIDQAGNVTRTDFEIKEPTITNLKKYTIKEDKFIRGIEQGTELKTFSENSAINQKYTVYRNNKELKESDILKTGDVLEIGKKEYTLIVSGDLNKDGKVSIIDLMKMKRYIIANNELTELELKAGDINDDGKIDIIDVMRCVRIITNKDNITK